MKNNVIGFLLTICFYALAYSATAQESEKADLPKIGLSAPLSLSWGVDVKNALLFANKHFANNKYQIIIEDDKCVGKDAVTVAHKLINIDRINYVVGDCSATVLSAAPVYDAANVIQMSPLASSSKIGRTPQVIYRTIPSDQDSAKILFDYVAKHSRILGVLTESADYSADFYEDFVKNNSDNKIEIRNEFYLPEESNFSSLLLKFKAAKVDGIFINANSERNFLRILKQIKTLRLPVAIYGALLPGSRALIEMAGENGNGIVFVDFPQNDRNLTSEGKKYYELYLQEYGKPQGWDIVVATTIELFRVIDKTIQSKKPPRDYLANTTFEGLFGPYRFKPNGDIDGLSPVLRRIYNGRAEELIEQ